MYLGPKKFYRRDKDIHPHEYRLLRHRGSGMEFMRRVETAARDYARKRHSPSFEGYARQYADHLWDLIRDERTLFSALTSLKGEAPGPDGVALVDVWRHTLFRQVMTFLVIPRPQWPAFEDTTIARAPPALLLPVQKLVERKERLWLSEETIANAPEEERRAKHEGNSRPKLFKFVHTPRDGRPAKQLLGGMWWTFDPRGLLLESLDSDEALIRFQGEVIHACLNLRRFDPKSEIDIQWLHHIVNPDGTQYTGSVEQQDRNRDAAIVKNLEYGAARWLGSLLTPRNGQLKYRPQPLRPAEVPKPDGGKRVLHIANVIDRVVERAALLVLQPVMEEIFTDSVVGCRMGLDRFNALSAIQRAYPDVDGKFLLCADIRKAFDSVPHEALKEVLDRYIPEPMTRHFLHLCVDRPGARMSGVAPGRGIPQGSPLSALFLNLLLHDRLDVPFLEAKPRPLLYCRYVDDLAVFGFRTRKEGERLLGILRRLLAPLGLELHDKPPKTAIYDLSAEGAMFQLGVDHDEDAGWTGPEGFVVRAVHEGLSQVERYLGLGMRGRPDGTLALMLPPDWRQRIDTMFREAWRTAVRKDYDGDGDAVKKHFIRAARGWLWAFSPAWTEAVEVIVAEELHHAANRVCAGTGEAVTVHTCRQQWRRDHQKWRELYGIKSSIDLACKPRAVNRQPARVGHRDV